MTSEFTLHLDNKEFIDRGYNDPDRFLDLMAERDKIDLLMENEDLFEQKDFDPEDFYIRGK